MLFGAPGAEPDGGPEGIRCGPLEQSRCEPLEQSKGGASKIGILGLDGNLEDRLRQLVSDDCAHVQLERERVDVGFRSLGSELSNEA